MENICLNRDLHYCSGNSDKVYHLALVTDATGCFEVLFAYGRRGSTLQYGKKTKTPTTEFAATKIYNKYLMEKLNEGYSERPGISGKVFAIPAKGATAVPPVDSPPPAPVLPVPAAPVPAHILPQLLNAITEEQAVALLGDPTFGMQEKKNGTRLIVKSEGGEVTGINRKGKPTTVATEIVEAVRQIGMDCVLDGEAVGPVYHVFDCLGYNSKDIRPMSYKLRYDRLATLVAMTESWHGSGGVKLVPLATAISDLRKMWKDVKANKGEGYVFKKLSAPYTPGRPASGGDQFKYKLWNDCSSIVIGINDQRSVRVAVIEAGSQLPVGNVTIPANHAIPDVGDVVSIRYLYAYKGGSLYQPIYEGKRPDQDESDCGIGQLIYFEPEYQEAA